MIKPEQILTENKDRDAQILEQYWVNKLSQKDIAISFSISQARVSQILYENRSLIKYDPDYEKSKRIRHYEAQYEMATPENHTQEHWLEKIRDEVEGQNQTQAEQPSWLNGRLTSAN